MLRNDVIRNGLENRWKRLIWAVVVVLLLSGCEEKKPKVYRVGILSGD